MQVAKVAAMRLMWTYRLSRFRVTDLKRKQPTVLNFFMYGIEVVINERFISTSLSHHVDHVIS